jgi:transcriptional regulator with XRE-family HTH domain
MKTDFPRLLTLLRSEAKLSQKKVSEDLGVNQALLSHYEKGKRECGLEFILKAADYYQVSTDYLLGRSPSRNGAMLTKDDIPRVADFGENTKEFSAVLTKRLLVSSIEIIYSLMAKTKNAELIKRVGTMLSMPIYRAFRLVHMCNPNNEEKMFSVDTATALRTALSAEIVTEAQALQAANKTAQKSGTESAESPPEITTKFLEKKYSTHATAMMNLMRNCEKTIQKYEQI